MTGRRGPLSRMLALPLLLLFSWSASLAADPAEPAMEALSTRHFRLHLRADEREEGVATAAHLEALRGQYEATVGSLVALREQEHRFEIYTFDGPQGLAVVLAEHPELALEDEVYPGEAQARASGMIAVDATGILGSSDLAVMFHGVAHLCNDALLYEPGVDGSWWVREGIASYLMQTPYGAEGGFKAGKVRTSEGYITDTSKSDRVAESHPHAAEPKKSLAWALDAYKKGRHIPLPELLDHGGATAWRDEERRDLAAVQAWVLFHFLLHGPEEELRSRLARFLDLERRGEGGAEAFKRVVSGDLVRLEPLVQQHAKEMR